MPLLLGKHNNKPLPALGNETAAPWWDEGHYLLIGFVYVNPGILTPSFVRSVVWKGMCVIAPKPCSMDHEFVRKSKNFFKEFGFGDLKMKCIRGRQGSWLSVGPMVGKTLKECSQSLGSVLTKLSNEFLEYQGSVGFFAVVIVHVDSKGKKQVVEYNSNAEARSYNYEMCTDGPHKQTPITRYFAPKSHKHETDDNEKKGSLRKK